MEVELIVEVNSREKFCFDAQADLFSDLSDRGGHDRLTGLCMASGKFPIVTTIRMLHKQNPAFGIQNHRRRAESLCHRIPSSRQERKID